MNFNKSFYRPNTEATVEDAEKRLKEEGYSNFHFKSVSRSNGVSFYFETENGQEIRVSDHPLAGKRAFDVIDIPLYKILKTNEMPGAEERKRKLAEKREREAAEAKVRLAEMIRKRNEKKMSK